MNACRLPLLEINPIILFFSLQSADPAVSFQSSFSDLEFNLILFFRGGPAPAGGAAGPAGGNGGGGGDDGGGDDDGSIKNIIESFIFVELIFFLLRLSPRVGFESSSPATYLPIDL